MRDGKVIIKIKLREEECEAYEVDKPGCGECCISSGRYSSLAD
jgi:hypothetical protein